MRKDLVRGLPVLSVSSDVAMLFTGGEIACVFGGVSQYGQVKEIKKGAETLIACPGRLIDLMTQGIIFLDQVECFVLDEADRMLDMGFLPDIKRIISKLLLRVKTVLYTTNPVSSVKKSISV